MILDNMMAYSEVYEILNLLETEYFERVPKKVRDFFAEERLKEYKPKISIDIPLTEQNLQRETIVLLAILNLNYWCDTTVEKKNALNELVNNEQAKKEVEEKYNPDNLFNNKKKYTEKNELSTDLIVYKEENFVRRLLNKIKQLLKKDR